MVASGGRRLESEDARVERTAWIEQRLHAIEQRRRDRIETRAIRIGASDLHVRGADGIERAGQPLAQPRRLREPAAGR